MSDDELDNNILSIDMDSYFEDIEPYTLEIAKPDPALENTISFHTAGKTLLTFNKDGTVDKGEGWTTVDETSNKVVEIIGYLGWNKINELKSTINNLEAENYRLQDLVEYSYHKRRNAEDKVVLFKEQLETSKYAAEIAEAEIELLEDENMLLEAELEFFTNISIELENELASIVNKAESIEEKEITPTINRILG